MSRFATTHKQVVNLRLPIQILASLLIFFLFMRSATDTSGAAPLQNEPENPAAHSLTNDVNAETAVQNAWERVQTSGSYQFTADIVQISAPLPTITNAGRQGSRQTMYVEGETNLKEQQLRLSLWNQAGTVADSATAVQVRVEKDEAFIRQGNQPWEPASNFTTLFAPNSDFMNYLVAAKNIQEMGVDNRNGVAFTRYAFEINGPGYAAYMRDQMEAQMHASGELPAGMSLGLPQQYADMTGSGELWVTADGWPLRQIINLQLAAQNDSEVSAEITVNFSDFDKTAVAATTMLATPSELLTRQIAQLKTVDPVEPMTLLFGLLALSLFLWLIFKSLGSRKIYAALNLTIVLTMLGTPWLQDASAQQFSESQVTKAQEQEARDQESEMQQALTGLNGSAAVNPSTQFSTLNSDNGTDTDADGFTDVEEQLLGSNPISTPGISEANQQLQQIPPNDATDTDKDGLTDYTEFLVGTLEDFADSDGDGVSDLDEVKGFTDANNQTWFTNPLVADSNGDGMSDGQEWGIGTNARPDLDNDGLPDLFDPDNDGDFVPDRIDTSPYTSSSKVFNNVTPFELIIDDLTPNELTYVEIQLRPKNPDHLWYAFNVLDWPENDREGNIQDVDGATFFDYDPNNIPSPLPNQNGDIKLIPMLEIRVPSNNNNLPDQSILDDYGINVSDFPGGGKVVYLPLQVTTDPNTGEQVAFFAKMPYLPGAEWDVAHQMRLVWAVQALIDSCTEYDEYNQCVPGKSTLNEARIIQTYQDEWQITGLNVRENVVSKIATIYQNPATADYVANNDDNIWELEIDLEDRFNGAWAVTGQDGLVKRELPIEEIERRFDYVKNDAIQSSEDPVALRFGIDDVFSVDLNVYEHVDKALLTQATVTNQTILSTAYGTNSAITPTLLFAREDTYRSLNLDGLELGQQAQFTWSGEKLTVDMDATKIEAITMTTLKWSPYHYTNATGWVEVPMEDYWDELAQRHQAEFEQEFGTEDTKGALILAQLYYLAVYGGMVSIVQKGDVVLQKHPLTSDRPPVAQGALVGRSGAMFAVRLILEDVPNTASLTLQWTRELADSGGLAKSRVGRLIVSPGTAAKDTLGWARNLSTKGKIGAGVAVAVLLAAMIVGAYFLIDNIDNPDVQLGIKVFIAVAATYLLVILPALTLINTTLAVAATEGIAFSAAFSKMVLGAGEINKGIRGAAVVGLVISIGIAIGTFLYVLLTSDIAPGSIAFNQLIAQTIASIIVAVLLFALSVSLAGLILVGILSLIDVFFLIFGSSFSITGYVTEQIAQAIYSFELTIDEPDVDTGTIGIDFTAADGASKGLVANNPIQISLPVTTTITHEYPNGYKLQQYIYSFYTERNLTATSFVHQLDDTALDTSTSRSAMRSGWANIVELNGGNFSGYRDLFFTGNNVAEAAITVTPQAGINTSFPIYLNSAYALPGADCWTIPLDSAYCENRTLKGSSSVDIGSSVILDILPDTLDGFYAWDWSSGIWPLPVPKDHDGDGLIAQAYGGADPNDSPSECINVNGDGGTVCWDADGDGLGDGVELLLQENGNSNKPESGDYDQDHICDPEELRLGTNAGLKDSDGDGLWDGDEVWHLNCDSGNWEGGWDFTITITNTPTVVRMFSNPLLADADGDGINDQGEMDLYANGTLDAAGVPYSPHIFNVNPLGLTINFDDDDGIVGPGQVVAITTTVQNNQSVPRFAYGAFTAEIPSLSLTQTHPFDLFQNEQTSIVEHATMGSSDGFLTLEASAHAGLHDGSIEPTWAWNSITNPTTTIPGTAPLTGVALAPLPAGNAWDFSVAILEPPDNSYVSADPLLNGNAGNRQISDDSATNFVQINRITSIPDYEYNSDLVAATPPDVACNAAGECVTVATSAYWYDCKSMRLEHIYAINQSDGGNGSEFYIQRNGNDYNETFLRASGEKLWEVPSGVDLDDGETVSMGQDFVWCEGDTLNLWERDTGSDNADEWYCTFNFTDGRTPVAPSPSGVYVGGLREYYCNYSAAVQVKLYLGVEPANEVPAYPPSPHWQTWDDRNCTTIHLRELNVETSVDGGSSSNDAEYYINLNGTHRAIVLGDANPIKDYAAGTRIWTGPSAANGDNIVISNGAFRACRGDTIDIWERDDNAHDFICSIPVLGNSPAEPFGNNFSTEGNFIKLLSDLKWLPGNGKCTNSGGHSLDLTLSVTGNPKYTVTAGGFGPGGNLYSWAGKVMAAPVPYNSTSTIPNCGIFCTVPTQYYLFSNPVVASDGVLFLTAWESGSGDLQFRETNSSGGIGAMSTIYSGSNSYSNLDMVWTGQNYLAVWQVNASSGATDIYMARLNSFGQQIGSTQVVANGGGNERFPDLAVNPVNGNVMVVYQSSGFAVYGRLIKGATVGPEISIFTNATNNMPQVAFDKENNSWMASWANNTGNVAHVRLLEADDGTPFAPGKLGEATVDGIGGGFGNFTLECNNKTGSAAGCSIVTTDTLVAFGINKFQAIETPFPLYQVVTSTVRTLTIDAVKPTSTINLTDNSTFKINQPPYLLSGSASDTVSGITDTQSGISKVELNIDNGGWLEVSSSESWNYNWTPSNGDGSYTIQIRATDGAGNVEVAHSETVIVDTTPPTLTSTITNNAILPATQDSDGNWHVTLTGTTSDVSGVRDVLALAANGGANDMVTCAAGATCSWTIDYVLPGFDVNNAGTPDPTGSYTVELLATDNIGNSHDAASALEITFQVEQAAPIASLTSPDPLGQTQIITTPVTLSGTVTDPGSVASGVQSLEIDFVSSVEMTPTWQTAVSATLTSSGSNVTSTTWSYVVPTGLEGNFEILLRATDVLGNINDDPITWSSGWQGVIDTKDPVVELTVVPIGTGSAQQYAITLDISDANLTLAGAELPCSPKYANRVFETNDDLTNLSGGNPPLIGLNMSCIVNGNKLADPLTVRVFDRYGHETAVTQSLSAPANTVTVNTVSSANSLLAAPAQPLAPLAAPSIASTVLTPTDNTVLTSLSAVTIEGGAYAIDGLKTLTMTVNGTNTLTTAWTVSPVVTDTLWTTSWTPPGEGTYELLTVVEDQNGAVQTELQPITITVDTQVPTVTFDSTVLNNEDRLSSGRVALTGTISDNVGIENVQLSIDGVPAGDAAFDATSWRYVWSLGSDEDGAPHSVTVTASDGGNETSLTDTITVDIVQPAFVTPTLGVTDGNTAVTLQPGETVRDPQTTTLQLDWTASSDGSGIGSYEVDWSSIITPDLGTATSFASNATLYHEEMATEASAWFAHITTVDGAGNTTAQTQGPIYVDSPTTPDYINPDDGLTTNIYHGWMESGCSQIGANYEVFRNGLDGTSLTAVQEMYLTWDANNLRMAWVGANWDVDGDLFIYLDTAAGGATTAYDDPYSAVHTITLPAQGSNQLAANYVIYIEDGTTAELLAWNGSSWVPDQALGAPNYIYANGITDLYLPFSLLGNPTTMKLVALASEENNLQLWAAMPDKNPLNSERVVNSAALPFLESDFTLTQQFEWTNVGAAGVCPSTGQFENSDLQVTLTADPQGVELGFLEHDLPALTLPDSQLDSNSDGTPDSSGFPIDTNARPVGPGELISYTIHIANDGPADATGVGVTLNAYGALSLATGVNASNSLGTIAAGTAVDFTFSVVADSSADAGEVTAVISDNTHGDFDWLWALHRIDKDAPIEVTIVAPQYVSPGLNQIRGTVVDESAVPDLALMEVNGSSANCTDPSPADGEWICIWDVIGAVDGDTIQLQAKATDEWGNAGSFGSAKTLIVDANAPTITLDAASTAAFSDSLLLAGELLLQGQVTDNNAPAAAELCAQESSAANPTCILVDVNPNTGDWLGTLPINLSADGTIYDITLYGVDTAGNRSTQPITFTNIQVDTAGPDIDVTTFLATPVQFSNATVLAGTVTDGSGVASMNMWISKLDGTESIYKDDIRSGGTWSYSRTFTELGDYVVHLKATDSHGNITYVGPLALTVLDTPANLPPTIGLGSGFVINEGSTLLLDAAATDPNGDTLTYAWDLNDDNSVDGTAATYSFDASAIDASATPQQVTISLAVSDGVNAPVTAVTTISVVNANPTLTNLAATAIVENGTTTLSGTIVEPSSQDSLTLAIDWGDGSTLETFNYSAGTTSFSVTHQYLDDNPTGTAVDNPVISLTISDDDGGSSQTNTTVQISNSAPQLTNAAATAIDENGTSTLTGTIVDVGTLDSFKLVVDWGDGSTPEIFNYGASTTVISQTHQYLDDNPTGTAVDTYTISLTLTDDDAGNTASTSTVTVSNLNPTLSNVAITNVDENGTATLTGNLADVGTEDSFTLDVDWGDGTAVSTYSYAAGTTSFSETHQYLDDNPTNTAVDNYTVNLILTDDDTGSTTDSATVTVSNLNPTLSNVAITNVDENGTATLTGNMADVGTEDSFTLAVDWGDSTGVSTYSYAAGTTSFSETHQYLDDNPSGTAVDDYTVSLTLTDDDTGSDTGSVTVTVTNLNPTLSNTAITNVDENGVATLTGTMADVGTEDSFTLVVDWGDGTAVSTYSYAAGTAVFTETHQFIDDNPTNTASDPYTVNLTLTDDDTGQATDSLVVTVTNIDPILSNIAITDVNEDGVATLTGNLADVGTADSFTLDVDWGDSSPISTYSYAAGTTSFSETHQYLDDNPDGTAADPYTVSLTLTDDDTGSTADSTVVTVTNVAPVLSTDVPFQTLQYSDSLADITVTGTDVADDPLLASTSWNVDGGAFVPGLPDGLSLSTNVCLFSGNGRTCSWTISGISDVIAGVYTVRVTVIDDDLGQTSIDQIIEVIPEDARIRFNPDNPVAVQVNAPGSDSSLPFTLLVHVRETPESGANTAPGDINLAEVSITLEPVGPGSPTTVQCITTGAVPANDYETELTVTCDFSGIPVNAYVVATTVDGGYYTGYGEDVLVVFDPSLGFTTGGGWFYWPGTADPSTGYLGDRTNFGYTMSYNKKMTNVKGNLVMIRHLQDSDEIYRIKSNALGGLALGDAVDPISGETFGWASFTGKANYLQPGWEDPQGNYEFIVYVEDRDEPGSGVDQFWIEVWDKDDTVVPDLSMSRDAVDNSESLQGGNIVVPHGGSQNGNGNK